MKIVIIFSFLLGSGYLISLNIAARDHYPSSKAMKARLPDFTPIPIVDNIRKSPIMVYEVGDVQLVDTLSTEDKEEEEVKQDLVEHDQEEEERERVFTQLELSVHGVSEEKRGLMNWVMQMEYSGETFFDGYVWTIIFMILSQFPLVVLRILTYIARNLF
jgi:hypothetical protein